MSVPLTIQKAASFLWHKNDGLQLGMNRRSPTAMVRSSAERRANLDHLQRSSQARPNSKGAPLAAAPGLWDRFPTARTVQQMMETMERMMEDNSYGYSTTWATGPSNGKGGYGRGRPPWAIKERKEDYKMRFDMPGMHKEDVKVWVEEKMLVVKAEKTAKKTVSQEGQEQETTDVTEDFDDWSERYSCRIALPENIDFEKIGAEVKDGVLYITVPKASPTTKVLDINVK